jgi:KaiC/GvpD/RAD55 family RecA-like ATPase
MSNEHIFEFLDYYIGLSKPPQYAVMINGAWGIGKTYRVKKYVETKKAVGKQVCYVSLYGVKSTDEIDQLVLVAIMPMLGTPLGAATGRIAKAWAQKFGLGDAVDLSEVIKNLSIDLMIFDDFERTKVSPVEVLGYVNQFIEQEGRKAVLIANEVEAERIDPRYRQLREKVIGMTFDMQHEVNDALTYFIEEMQSPVARKFIQDNRDGNYSPRVG